MRFLESDLHRLLGGVEIDRTVATFAAEAGSYAGKWFDPKWKKNEEDAELKADRVWNAREAQAIADAVRGQKASVTEEAVPKTEASPGLFDLTSLQREANGRFGFSAKTTLALAQSLYERHKALTYPRTDSRHLPEDYLGPVKDTKKMLAGSGMGHLAPFAKQALDGGYVKPNKRIFDNKKVSDHFAIIPTLQAPSGLSEAEQKLYDLVVKRFLSVFFPSAEFLVTTRISVAAGHSFKSVGKVLVKPGWQAIWGKEADEEGDENSKMLAAVKPGEAVPVAEVEAKGSEGEVTLSFSFHGPALDQAIKALLREVSHLRQQMPEPGATGSSRNPRDELPPHY